jgi:branched-chain amino acid transport system substrate-binding protein
MTKISKLLALLFALTLIAAACGSDDEEEGTDASATETEEESSDSDADSDADSDESMEEGEMMEEGPLGSVRVEAGDQIQIRSLNAITGDVAFLGVPNERAVQLAIDDYGQINGFDVSLGTGLDDLCSADGGQAAAQTIVADEQVVGVIGTSCSGAATAAAPLISEAGMVMISPSNTSPALTSDQQGTGGRR